MNHKELEQLISGCEKVGGEVETIVHNQMTNSYSFTCH
jgi:collagenase-like PrtC family protease